MTSSRDDAGESRVIPRAIVAGHAAFPEGIISAVDQISGAGGLFIAVSNKGLCGDDIEEVFRAAAEPDGIKVFFTDLPAGSATLAVRRMMRVDSSIVLITGANVATLLEFAFCSGDDPVAAARQAADKGRAALMTHGGS
ncbi:MAG: hypothetical protein M3R07_13275 [Gemmatimonadota bacterium]|nr:hypothetical protein [Gemmatimonadota bacterium]